MIVGFLSGLVIGAVAFVGVLLGFFNPGLQY